MKKTLLIATIAGFAFAGNFNCGMCHNGQVASKLDNMTPAEIVKKAKASNNPMMASVKNMSDKELMEAAKEFGKK